MRKLLLTAALLIALPATAHDNGKKAPIFIGNAGGNRSQIVIAGDFMYLSGVRGTDPATGAQLPGPGPGNTLGAAPNANARIIRIYQTIKDLAASQGLSLFDCVSLVTSVTNAAYLGPTAELEALPQFWGKGPYPTRTHQIWLQMSGSDTIAEFPDIPHWPARGDIVEVQAVFFIGKKK
jgi:enamine deaminase RidA (YjgF/YER057c/UK114 family)